MAAASAGGAAVTRACAKRVPSSGGRRGGEPPQTNSISPAGRLASQAGNGATVSGAASLPKASYTAPYTSPRRASSTAARSGAAPKEAIARRLDTAAAGLPSASANPLTHARPTRTPVNDPGPEAAAKQSTAASSSRL